MKELNMYEVLVKNRISQEEASFLIDLAGGELVKSRYSDQRGNLMHILTEDHLTEGLQEVVEHMEGLGYRCERENGSSVRAGMMDSSRFGECFPILQFVQDADSIRIDITKVLENVDLLRKGLEHRVCGTHEGILYDGDLEEFLGNSGIDIAKNIFLREPEYDGNTSGIINFAEGETLGYVEVLQGKEVRYFRMVCADYSTEENMDYIDFSEAYASPEDIR